MSFELAEISQTRVYINQDWCGLQWESHFNWKEWHSSVLAASDQVQIDYTALHDCFPKHIWQIRCSYEK